MKRDFPVRSGGLGRACLLALALATPGELLHASHPLAGWHRIDSPHFQLTTNVEPARGRQLIENLEGLRHVLGLLAPHADLDGDTRTKLYLFAGAASFEPFRLSPGGLEAHPPPAYLVPHEDGFYGALSAEGQFDPQRALYKQYVREVLARRLPLLPDWFQRGVSEFYSTFKLDGRTAEIGLPVDEHRMIVGQSDAEQLALRRLVEEGESPEALAARMGPEYPARCWSVVHALLTSSDSRREHVRQYVRQVAGRKPPVQAFWDTFGTDAAALEAEILEYAARPQQNYFKLGLAEALAVEITVSELPPAAVETAFGDLVLHVVPGDPARALGHFERALALAPDDGPAWLGLGLAAKAARDHARAFSALEKAASLLPDDFRAQLSWGDALLAKLGAARPSDSSGLAQLGRAQEVLLRATELDPGSVAAWERLGFAYELSPEPRPEAARALEKARSLAPTRVDLTYNLLLAYARGGDRDSAQAMMLTLGDLGADEGTLRRAREVELQLDLKDAQDLLRKNRLSDAIAAFARIRAETTNLALAQQIDGVLAKTSAAEEFNRFAAAYQQGKDRLETGDCAGARESLGQLEVIARPGLQREVVVGLKQLIAEACAGAANPSP